MMSNNPSNDGNVFEHDLEGKPAGVWKDDDALNSVFNEVVELKTSFRAVKRNVLALLGLVIALLLTAFGVSFANLKHSKNLSIDENTSRMMTNSGNTVATIALGQSFKLPLFTFAPFAMNTDPNASEVPPRPNPYVCVGVESVVNMWRSTMFGIHTNAVIMGVYDGKFHSEEYGSEFGVVLSFQGSIQNRTHACLKTVDQNLQICINFENSRCGGTGTGADKVHQVNPTRFHRRKLFEDLVDPNTVFDAFATNTNGIAHHHGGRRMEENKCDFGHWCQDFAAVELVGPW